MVYEENVMMETMGSVIPTLSSRHKKSIFVHRKNMRFMTTLSILSLVLLRFEISHIHFENGTSVVLVFYKYISSI